MKVQYPGTIYYIDGSVKVTVNSIDAFVEMLIKENNKHLIQYAELYRPDVELVDRQAKQHAIFSILREELYAIERGMKLEAQNV